MESKKINVVYLKNYSTMQTAKARNVSVEVPSRTSAKMRATKSSGADLADSSCSKNTKAKTPPNGSPNPKNSERPSPRSPAPEKKRPSKLTELEAKVAQLQDDLKKTKEQLASSEASKKQAQQVLDDMNNQLLETTSKFQLSQNQLKESTSAEESRFQELRAISQDRDRAWQSEIEDIQRKNSSEIQRLNLQFKEELGKLRVELNSSGKAEAELEVKVVETQQYLEVLKATVETLSFEGSKLLELFKKSITELESSKAREALLEETVNQLIVGNSSTTRRSLDFEVEQLKSALEAVEMKYEEEQVRIAMQIKASFEVAESTRIESEVKECKLQAALMNACDEIDELKGRLLDKENELQGVLGMNDEMKAKLESGLATQVHKMDVIEGISELKANLLEKETELQNISEENKRLKHKLSSIEAENITNFELAITDMEMAKAKEKEATLKLEFITQEANKQSEQLETAKALKVEMEVELRRLRVQADQWRKAAEAAAAVLTAAGNNENINSNNNSRFVERTGSFDAEYQKSNAGKLMHSPFSEDDFDDGKSPKKKNGGVLRKFGLWKKTSSK